MSPEMIPTTEVLSRRKKTFLDYTCMFFQGLVLVFFVLVIIFGAGKSHKNIEKNDEIFYVLFIIIYIVYMILEFCSSSCSYLMHKSSSMGIYDNIYRLVSTHPEIIFHCETYHYEYRRNYRQPGNQRPSKQRVTTYREDYPLPYYSSRDISGLFALNCDKNVVQNKAYIQLELLEEINFADSISYMDYEAARSDFYMRNRPRDYYMDYSERRHVPGLTQYNLVKLGNAEPIYVNIGFFILATIFMCAEFYKCQIDKLCVPQRFIIRKIISTRYDLNIPRFQQQYQYFMPALDLYNQQYTYKPEDYTYLNNNYQADYPTQEELERAGQYSSKVPDYQIQSYSYVNGDIKVGVVKNDPSYCSANYSSEIPPSCVEKNKQCIQQFEQKYEEEGLMKYPQL